MCVYVCGVCVCLCGVEKGNAILFGIRVLCVCACVSECVMCVSEYMVLMSEYFMCVLECVVCVCMSVWCVTECAVRE